MALAQLDGPGEDEIGKSKGKVKKVVVRVAAEPARASFLGLVRLNMFHLANHLATAWKEHKAETQKFWEDFGGRSPALLKEINLGAKAHLTGPKHHAKKVARKAKHAAKKATHHAQHAAHKAEHHVKHAAHKAEHHAHSNTTHHGTADGDGPPPPDDGQQRPDDGGYDPTQDVMDTDQDQSAEDTGSDDSQDTGSDSAENTDEDSVDDSSEDSGEDSITGELYMSGRGHDDIWDEMITPHVRMEHKAPAVRAFNEFVFNEGKKIGVVAAVAPVAATPILFAVANFLKKLKIASPEDVDKLVGAATRGSHAMSETPDTFPPSKELVDPQAAAGVSLHPPKKEDDNTLLYAGAGVAALVVISQMK